MTDPITDMLNQIRNAQAMAKAEVSVPLSNFKYEIAKILTQEGFISEVKKTNRRKEKILRIILKYNDGVPAISGLRKVSKPGQRIYKKTFEIKSIKGRQGIAIISTPQGLMTNKKARKLKLGGEIICEIW